MVHMGMRHKDGIKRSRIKGEGLIVLLFSKMPTLKKAAIDQKTMLTVFNQMTRTGYFLGGTVKGNFGQITSLTKIRNPKHEIRKKSITGLTHFP